MIRIYYHSSDLDGHCSGAITKYKYPEAELFPINYNQKFPWKQLDEKMIQSLWLIFPSAI